MYNTDIRCLLYKRVCKCIDVEEHTIECMCVCIFTQTHTTTSVSTCGRMCEYVWCIHFSAVNPLR